jgi:hypothetical protein
VRQSFLVLFLISKALLMSQYLTCVAGQQQQKQHLTWVQQVDEEDQK